MINRIRGNIKKHYRSEYENVPVRKDLIKWINQLIETLFPLKIAQDSDIERALVDNQAKLYALIIQTKMSKEKAQELSSIFYNHLEQIHLDLIQDAEEFLNNDPAAKCLGEVLHTYPGFYAIAIYRIAHQLHHSLELPYMPRMLTEYAHSKTGIDIHPAAEIGVPFLIDHGTGVVIGETCKIGKHVNIYQGVTLGALQVKKGMQNLKRHPTIEDNVVIYANATILGGNTIVGNHSIIGGNVFLTKSVEPYSLVFSKSDTHIKKLHSKNEAINFII
ncbi:MAG: serine O-acetyltransferase [Weeksellaceae bacterium]